MARDQGFKEEIESDEEDGLHIKTTTNETSVHEELEMSELSTSTKVVHQVKGSAVNSSLDSIMEDNEI